MIPGYAGKFLDVDLSSGVIKETSFSDEVLLDYVGGRGLATKILWDRLGSRWEKVDPLGPENILLYVNWAIDGLLPGREDLCFWEVAAEQRCCWVDAFRRVWG